MAGRCRPHRSDEDLHDGDHGDHRGVPPARRELVEHVSGDRMGRIGRIRRRPRSSRTRRSGCRRSCAGEDAVGRRPAPRRPTEMPYGEGCPPFRSFGGLTPEGHGGYIAEMSTGIRLHPVSRRLGGAPSADQCPDCPPTRGGQSDSGWLPLPAVDGATNRRGPIGRVLAAQCPARTKARIPRPRLHSAHAVRSLSSLVVPPATTGTTWSTWSTTPHSELREMMETAAETAVRRVLAERERGE